MDIVIVPVLVIGILLGLLELIFVHQDEAGMGWVKHGFHALPMMFLFLFISMNVPLVEQWIGMDDKLWFIIAVRVVVGVVAAIKIKAAAAVAGRVGENWPHVLIIAGLVVAAPFVWEAFACTIPFIQDLPLSGCPAPAK
ncbi:MAG: hypothetical protein ACP5NW_02655 [Candidatus Woesearchaeota archaeon]